MPNRQISRDVKIAAIKLHERELLQLPDILDCCGFSERTFYRILKLWRDTGDVVSPNPSLRGRPRLLDREDISYVISLVCANPEYFLDELLSLVKNNRFVSVHFSTIFKELERAGMSRKKLSRIATERNEGLRADFIARMAQYEPRS